MNKEFILASGKMSLIGQLIAALLVLAYMIFPLDLLPDFLGPVGRIDDLAIFGLLAYYLFTGRNPLSFLWRGLMGNPGRGPRMDRNEGHRAAGAEDRRETDPYRVLEIERGASLEEIHRAYRRQVARYHPDKVSHLGTEFQDLAHRKFVQIKSAYEELLRLHGARP
jgi:hypothetical protein